MPQADLHPPLATPLGLNALALGQLEKARPHLARLGVSIEADPLGEIWDAGVHQKGGLEAGLLLARVCLAGLAEVSIGDVLGGPIPFPVVTVRSDQPVRACLLSQYAGWQVSVGDFFAMGSGPMRASYAQEAIFQKTAPGLKDPGPEVVGVLESAKLPGTEVLQWLRTKIGETIRPVLLVAGTKSLAGGVQVVARSLETALHKLHELHFPLESIVCGIGSAPLPPPAKGTLDAIGRTNDAILYAGRVVIYARCEDELIQELGPKAPSTSSAMHGRPFGEILKEAGGDFYKVDPHLFAPAELVMVNLASGRTFCFGKSHPEIFLRSCGL